MQRLEIRKYLFDIQQACRLIGEFTAGKAFEDYKTESMLRSAVERQFEIIGEALNQMLRLDPRLEGRISHSARIVAFRNRLIHGYAAVADDVVWGVVEAYLPLLAQEVEGLLADEDTESE